MCLEGCGVRGSAPLKKYFKKIIDLQRLGRFQFVFTGRRENQAGGCFCALEVVLWGGCGGGFLGCEWRGWGFLGVIVIVFLGFLIVFSFLIRFFPLYYW